MCFTARRFGSMREAMAATLRAFSMTRTKTVKSVVEKFRGKYGQQTLRSVTRNSIAAIDKFIGAQLQLGGQETTRSSPLRELL